MMRQKLAFVVTGSPSFTLKRMNGFSPVKITWLGSAGIAVAPANWRGQSNPKLEVSKGRRHDQDHPCSPRPRRRHFARTVSGPRRSGVDPGGPPAGAGDGAPHPCELDPRCRLCQPAQPVSDDRGGAREAVLPATEPAP